MSITLVGYPVSPFVRKVRVVLEQKGIGYTLDPAVPYIERQKVLAVNPAGTVPVLLPGDGLAPVTESADIAAWAEQSVPLPVLIPPQPELRQRALQIQQFADSQMAQVFGGMMFGQRIVVPYYFGKAGGKEDMVEHAMTVLVPQLLDALAEFLADAHYAAGTFSVADIALSSWLRGAELAGFALDDARWPSIRSWLDRCYAQPGYARVIADEEQLEVVRWARSRYEGAA
ncbi:glutathione S-transferase family protein [Leisingera daeponensis]|uniref:Glutathione S-transferase family protein n=1 Tax=Leisingera daeponensis TaxID=405746 RepID=A0ABS7NKE0_9RHOB|nr:glutathione S-transferase family protein [Leisingera daeponensis]MBY6141307.1 glutathione S-transferase family protein [Leisingera daeponensis]